MPLLAPTIPPSVLSPSQIGGQVGVNLAPQLARIYKDLPNFFLNYDYSGIISTLKITGIILTVVFTFILGWIIYKSRKLVREKIARAEKVLNPPQEAQSAYDARWQEIRKHIASFNPAEWKFAVIEADKLVDNSLEAAGFKGETMGERLTLITNDQLPEINNLWEAHKLRNLLVHDLKYEIGHNYAIAAADVFERVLKELGAIKG